MDLIPHPKRRETTEELIDRLRLAAEEIDRRYKVLEAGPKKMEIDANLYADALIARPHLRPIEDELVGPADILKQLSPGVRAAKCAVLRERMAEADISPFQREMFTQAVEGQNSVREFLTGIVLLADPLANIGTVTKAVADAIDLPATTMTMDTLRRVALNIAINPVR